MAEFLRAILYLVAIIAFIAGLLAFVFSGTALLTPVYFLIFTVAIGATAITAEIREQASKSRP